MGKYIHGYLTEEQERLMSQAGILTPLIYPFIDLKNRKNVLEIGSGVGAQSQVILSLYSDLDLTCVEIEKSQIEKAQINLSGFSDRKINFVNQDAAELNFGEKFDAGFICWVLEHVEEPKKVLRSVYEHLHPEGVIYLTEVFNSSFYFLPKLPGLERYYNAYNAYQIQSGGDPDIGVKLGNLLHEVGFGEIELQRGGFHLDQSRPEELKRMTAYWKELMKSAAKPMLDTDLISENDVREMESDLEAIAKDSNSVFFYQFVQAKAKRKA
ncbi:Methyltransferase domain-containing protein [Algoriphagus ornithinivorans]|uniref:Methyltransferase domain-containing protein n=1 Tax=Algoriphagus ornithinivorans TaxID=226506 RepID=A0A1I5E7X2_9BACT|nr:class I SAM-dependent methyltransferase [Algoriphagus ornithinivorans]SFO07527.1 Methyltransferase domain-containing protein [Algoriphagus ornithinivorans]